MSAVTGSLVVLKALHEVEELLGVVPIHKSVRPESGRQVPIIVKMVVILKW